MDYFFVAKNKVNRRLLDHLLLALLAALHLPMLVHHHAPVSTKAGWISYRINIYSLC